MVEFLALLYIRDGAKTIFPVEDIDHAVRLADAIADSDLLDPYCGFNMFDAFYFAYGRNNAKLFTRPWEGENGVSFEEYWKKDGVS